MLNSHDQNLRSYPAEPRQPIIHKPIALPAPDYSPINPLRNDDGWESIDKNVGQPWHPPVVVEDENDWGGLGAVTTETNVIVRPNKSGPTTYRSDEYYSSIFAPDVDKFKWVVPGVLAGGPHPFYFSFVTDLKDYKKAGFKAILSIYEEPLAMKKVDGFQYYLIPTEEGKACDLEATCKFIDAMEKLNKPVFVHSFAGAGRTGIVLAAYLMYKNWLTADEAISYIRLNYNKYAIETPAQEDALHRFALEL